MTSITPAEARAYFKRWGEVSEFEIAERRKTPMGMKLRQLSAMMASRHLFPADLRRERDAQRVRQRWARLRKVLGG